MENLTPHHHLDGSPEFDEFNTLQLKITQKIIPLPYQVKTDDYQNIIQYAHSYGYSEADSHLNADYSKQSLEYTNASQEAYEDYKESQYFCDIRRSIDILAALRPETDIEHHKTLQVFYIQLINSFLAGRKLREDEYKGVR